MASEPKPDLYLIFHHDTLDTGGRRQDGSVVAYGRFTFTVSTWNHESETPYGLSNTTWPEWDGLTVTGQYDVGGNSDPWLPYAFVVQYSDLYSLRLADARAKFRTLQAIERKFDKWNQQLGYVARGDLAGYVQRFGTAIGAKGIILRPRLADREWSRHTGFGVVQHAIGAAILAEKKKRGVEA